jgi:hypothetical protein
LHHINRDTFIFLEANFCGGEFVGWLLGELVVGEFVGWLLGEVVVGKFVG